MHTHWAVVRDPPHDCFPGLWLSERKVGETAGGDYTHNHTLAHQQTHMEHAHAADLESPQTSRFNFKLCFSLDSITQIDKVKTCFAQCLQIFSENLSDPCSGRWGGTLWHPLQLRVFLSMSFALLDLGSLSHSSCQIHSSSIRLHRNLLLWPLMALWSLSPDFGLSWLNALDLQPLIAELHSRFASMPSMSSLHSSLLISDHRFCSFFEEHPVVLPLPSIRPGISSGEQVPGDLPKYTHHTWQLLRWSSLHICRGLKLC